MIARWTAATVIAACLALPCQNGAMADYGDALDTGGDGISFRYVIHAVRAIEQGHVSEAIEFSNRALAIYPAFIRARFTRGRAELAAADAQAAIADFDQVIAAHPEYPMVYALRGQARLYAHDTARAIEDFNAAFKAPVGAGSYTAADILAVRSVAYEMIGQNDLAIANLKQALSAVAITTRDWSMLNYRCYVAAIVGLLDTAAEACDESIERHTRNMDVYDSRGLVELKQHAWARAAADYTQSLYYRPDLSYSLYGRGLARQAVGDAAGARADMQAASAAEPHIAEIVERLGATAQVAGQKR